ncbi:MAG: hypothetical protein ACPGTO_10670 [Polaribacter sp.]
MPDKPALYFKNDMEWRNWLLENHVNSKGIYLIFYKVENKEETRQKRIQEIIKLCEANKKTK